MKSRLLLVTMLASALGCASSQKAEPAPATAEPAAAPAPAPAPAAEEAAPVEAPPEDHPLFVGYDAFNAHDFEKAVQMFAEDAEWHSSSRPGEPFKGRDGVLGAFKAWGPLDPAAGAMRIFVVSNEMMIVEGVVAGKQVGEYRGKKASNKPYGQAYAHVVTFDDKGLVKKLVAVSNGLAVPVQVGAMKSPRPISPVALPLADTEIVLGEGNAANAKAFEDVLAAWHAGKEVAIADMLADDVTVRYRAFGAEMTDAAKIAAAEAGPMKALTGGSSDYQVKAIGDYVVGFGTHTATLSADMPPYKKSDKPFTWHEVTVIKFDGDKIVEMNRYTDPLEWQLALAGGKG